MTNPKMAGFTKLECMDTSLDGAHYGLADWYSEIERGIQDALNKNGSWTTGWYASKKEIAWANITVDGNTDCITVEVSVSDDFDTPGMGICEVPRAQDLEVIREAIYEAWEKAEKDKDDNRVYVGYSITTCTQGRIAWVETYIKQRDIYPICKFFSWRGSEDFPPGDSYHKWGFQEEYEIPIEIKEKLEEWAQENECGAFTFEGFTIKSWE